jgi:hypothetical protein
MAPGLALNMVVSNEPTTNEQKAQKEITSVASKKFLSARHDVVLKSFRILVADLCQQFNGGHPGFVNTLSLADFEC